MKSWFIQHTGILLFILVVALGIIVSPPIGASWDEPDNIYAAGVYWNFLTKHDFSSSWFDNRIYSQNTDLSRYPPVPLYIGTLIVALGARMGFASNAEMIFGSFHIATVLFFGLMVATVFRCARLLKLSYGASVLAALLTFLYPSLFGYGFSNVKDTAQAAMFTVSLFYLLRGKLIRGGLLWGLAMATKFNAIYVPIIWGIWLLMQKKFSFTRIITPVAIGLITCFIVWPYLWFDPIHRTIAVIRYFTTVGVGYAFLWNGQLFRTGTGESLWWYPWAYMFVSTPILVIIFAVMGVVRVVGERGQRSILLIWLLVPTVRAVLPTASLYDGLRHFVEVLPAIAIISAIGFESLAKIWPKTGMVMALITLIYLVSANVSLFPYSSGYYNEFVKDANSNFDRDIEALSVKESMIWLRDHFQNFRVWSRIGGHLAWYWLLPGDRYVYSPEEADFVILVNKSSHVGRAVFEEYIGSAFVLEHRVERGGAIVSRIYRRK